MSIKIDNRLMPAKALSVIERLASTDLVMTNRYGEQRKTQVPSELAQLAPTVSAVIHEMQKETGRSVGFIAINGERLADTLPG